MDAVDRQARFLEHFLRTQDDLRAVIGSLVRERHSAEDVFQETALVLWKKFDEYDATRPFGAWARGIAVRKAMQFFEKQHRAPAPFSPDVLDALLDAYDRYEAEDAPLREALETCVRKLPERSRRLLAVRYDEGLKLHEMAARLGKTLDAVHKTLSRIREALRRCVERELAVPG
jgi:RNA polymerase sigma-70 factor (ECF subfamily)